MNIFVINAWKYKNIALSLISEDFYILYYSKNWMPVINVIRNYIDPLILGGLRGSANSF